MVVYVARCTDLREANVIQKNLIASESSLVFFRILTRLSDLDVFNAEILKSADDQTALGQVSFCSQSKSKKLGRLFGGWFAAAFLAISFGLFLIANRLGDSSASTSMSSIGFIIGSLIIVLTAISYAALSARLQLSSENQRKDRKIFRKAQRWLKKRRPVVIFGSDLGLDQEIKLPSNTLWFYQQTDQTVRQSART